ncbi:rhamnogalacturonan acetylesterase [Stenotrophomonas pictorum JCM 9942]|uniref:Rhamnogalacturonan acetylesterase n=1 Tax=Stenotrophomonas pictorum JCM 9942 TaxID=1236960 RepID=A0A0R0AVY3_9GAMM|nr:GDSL-type esterase/lipase family protein [Stenotrophomonas pictorum]KRG44547.1 rhamnogalacturonan acetylesterase [Stenotrophomonas pictorum JCM 9942]
MPMKRHVPLLLALLSLAGLASAAPPAQRVFIAADSTAATYGPERAPQAGWGQMLQSWLDPGQWQVRNHAIGGRSTRSFLNEGRLQAIEKELRPGDVLLIQFGHNDAKFEDPTRYTDPDTDYPALLSRYVATARAKGATPVLITPVARLLYDFGALLDTHGLYTRSMQRLAREQNVPLIDLNASSMAWIRALGEQGAQPYFMFVPEQGKADGTHFSAAGATAVACLVMRGWVELQPEMKAMLKRDIDCGAVTSSPTATATAPRSAATALALSSPAAVPKIEVTNPHGSQVIREQDIAREQPGPHGGAGPTTAYSFFADVADLPFVLRKRVLHKGAGIGLHPQHKDEIYYIVSGRGRYVLDGTHYDVGAGHALLTRAGSTHALQQHGEADLVLLLAYPAIAPR